MKVLLPTRNKIKIEKWGSLIKELGYELITLNDLEDTFVEPKEDGKTVFDNALKKAEFYYRKTGIVTLTTDSSLYIDGLSNEEQIGLFAGRKINRDKSGNIVSEEKLSDEQNYQRLKNVIEGLGGEAKGRFEECLVIYYGDKAYDYELFTMERLFKTPGSEIRKENAPMRSFAYYPELNRYRSELTSEEANNIEGDTFDKQRRFLNKGLYKVNHLMEYNLNYLIDRILECKSKIKSESLKEELQAIQNSCICIGNGGSYAASLFSSLVLKEKNRIITVNKQPRDVLYEDLSLFENIFAVTYGNNNYGISKALEKARESGLNTYALTNNPSMDSLDNIVYYKTVLEKEYSFISMSGTFMPMTIMLMYYLGVYSENDMNELLRTMYGNAKAETYNFDKEDDIFEIISGDNTYVASEVLKSTIAEGGIGIPVASEKYNYCHGLSNMVFYHPNTTLIYLINGQTTDIDLKLLSEISPYYKNVIKLHSNEKDKIIGEFDLAMKALFLCSDIAKSKEKDLSKVKYSPVVKKVYRFKGDM